MVKVHAALPARAMLRGDRSGLTAGKDWQPPSGGSSDDFRTVTVPDHIPRQSDAMILLSADADEVKLGSKPEVLGGTPSRTRQIRWSDMAAFDDNRVKAHSAGEQYANYGRGRSPPT